jgi:hypothetical protein
MDGHIPSQHNTTNTMQNTAKKPEVAATLNNNEKRNKQGEWTSSEWTVSLFTLSTDELEDQLDANNIPPIACDIIRSWAGKMDLNDSKVIPEWMRNPAAGSQEESLNIVTKLDGLSFKNAFKAIDLEHRKVTEKDGKVAELVELKDQFVYDYKLNKLVPKKAWTKDGAPLFDKRTAFDDIYNLGLRAVRQMKGVEDQFDANTKQARSEGYITIVQKKNKKKFVTTMLKPKEIKKHTTTVSGKEYTSDQLAAAVKLLENKE